MCIEVVDRSFRLGDPERYPTIDCGKLLMKIRVRHLFVLLTLSAIYAHCAYSPFYPSVAINGSTLERLEGGREFQLTFENTGLLPIWYNGTSEITLWHFVNDPSATSPHVLTSNPSAEWTILNPGAVSYTHLTLPTNREV